MFANRLWGTALFGLVLMVPGELDAQEPLQKPVTDGVYTEEQAERGQRTMESVCSMCHKTEWFASEEWKENWGWGEVYWFYDFIRNNMPYEQPGTLAPQAYRDVVAYVLKLNGYPAGTYDLPTTDEGWIQLVFPGPG